MYFLEARLFNDLCQAGLELLPRDFGVHRIGDTAGYIVNPDALSLDALNRAAATAWGAGHHVRLDTDTLGFWHVAVAAPEADADADPAATPTDNAIPNNAAPDDAARDDAIPDDAAPDHAEESPVGVAGTSEPTPDAADEAGAGSAAPDAATADSPAPAADIPRPQFYEAEPEDPATRFAHWAIDAVRDRLTLPIRLLKRAPDSNVCGLPEREADTLTIVIAAVPGAGPIDALGPGVRLQITDPLHDRPHGLTLPSAHVPEGMRPLVVDGQTAGCYDDRTLALFTEATPIIALALPAWLENFATPSEPASARAHDARVLAEAAQRGRPNEVRQMNELRQRRRDTLGKLTDIALKCEALDSLLQHRQPSFDTEAVVDQVERLRDSQTWTIQQPNGNIRFVLRDHRVRDPRDGTLRLLPDHLDVNLQSWLTGNGPFSANRDDPDRGGHPRVCGSHFLQAEIEEAVQDCLRAGDITGGLDLIRDVLTSFETGDPDIDALDAWCLADT